MTTEKFIKLLKQIHNGDLEKLTPIFSEYYGKMVVTAQYILHNEHDAQDAAANVILKIIKFAERNENPKIDNVGVYINTAIKNAAIDIYNEKKKTLCLDFLEDVLADTNNDNNMLINNIALREALGSLTDQDREIAMMFYFYDYKIKKIAKDLNLPEGTIKWKLSEIRKKLYNDLK